MQYADKKMDTDGSGSGETSLFRAIEAGDTTLAIRLIESGTCDLNERDRSIGLTPLHLAVYQSNLAVVQALVGKPQTNYSVKDNYGRSAVDMLEYCRDREVTRVLLEAAYPTTLRDGGLRIVPK